METLQTENNFDRVAQLLNWYDQARRSLPWRINNPDPYHVWLSEVMLQQTTVVSVIPRYAQFIRRWPDLRSLAAATLDNVLHEWQGLGYYARARNLYRCAQVIVSQHGGNFPGTEKALRDLPGIGDYTAAAIVAIAFGEPAAPVDGNIIRVLARLDGLEQVMPAGKQAVRQRMAQLVSVVGDRPGDFAQGLMDLGATLCTPRNPDCGSCPWHEHCRAYAGGAPETYPRKAARKQKPTRYGVVFWLCDDAGKVLLRRRADKGLLGGMMEFPSTDWCQQGWVLENAIAQVPAEWASSDITWQEVPGVVRHTFTHFHLELQIVRAQSNKNIPAVWSLPEDFGDLALPSVMKKIARLVENSTRIFD